MRFGRGGGSVIIKCCSFLFFWDMGDHHMVWAILGEEYNKAINEIIASDSDRIIAVVGGAMLDDTLRRTLEERLRDNKDINKKLFRATGPLGNLGPKIDL